MVSPLCHRLVCGPVGIPCPPVCTGGGTVSHPHIVGGFGETDPVGVRRGTCTTFGTSASGADTRDKAPARRTPRPGPVIRRPKDRSPGGPGDPRPSPPPEHGAKNRRPEPGASDAGFDTYLGPQRGAPELLPGAAAAPAELHRSGERVS